MPRQRSCRESGEGDGCPFGFVQKAEAWQPLRRGEEDGEESSNHDADTDDSDTPARTPTSPADRKEVGGHDEGETGGGARVTGKYNEPTAATQQRNPAPSCPRLGGCSELMDRKQHPRSEAHALDETEVYGLAAHEPGVSKGQRAQ